MSPADLPPLSGAASVHRTIHSRRDALIAYEIGGDGPAIVLFPSLGRGAEDFGALACALIGAGFRVVRPEPRGIGASTPLRAGETLHDMAADIAALIEAERLAPAILVGHAAGNWVARVLAHDRPDLTRGVALLAAIVTAEPTPNMRASISASYETSLPDEVRLHHLSRAYFATGADPRVWLDGWHPAVATAQQEAARLTPDRGWRRVADTHPTLYVGAAEDAISPPPTLTELRDAIGPNASLVVVGDAGHALLPEKPDDVFSALVHWIEGLTKGVNGV